MELEEKQRKDKSALNSKNISVGLMAALLACTGAAVFVIDIAYSAGYSKTELISWVFAIYTFGGIASLYLSFTNKMPLIGAHSLAGAAFVGVASQSASLSELAGSYLICGLIISLIGFTRLFSVVIQSIPVPLINAMLAGILVNYVAKTIPAIVNLPIVGFAAVAGFFLMPLISKNIPRFIGALFLGTLSLLLFHSTSNMNLQSITFIAPHIVIPSFSLMNVFFISIPLAFIILSNDTAIALSSLKRNEFQPAISKTVVASGFATIIAGLFGGHAAGVGGMTTALCSSEEAGEKSKRYWSAIVGSILITLFGLFSWFTISVIQLVPQEFISIIAGFSLLSVLISSLKSAFSTHEFQYSTTFTFLIAVSDVSYLQVPSVVWALLIGIISSRLLMEGQGKI